MAGAGWDGLRGGCGLVGCGCGAGLNCAYGCGLEVRTGAGKMSQTPAGAGRVYFFAK